MLAQQEQQLEKQPLINSAVVYQTLLGKHVT